MAICVYFPPAGFTTKQYGEVLERLEQAGVGTPKGRLHHSCFGDPSSLQVVDVWESQETFDAFGQALMPILSGVGYQPAPPMIEPVHNIIVG